MKRPITRILWSVTILLLLAIGVSVPATLSSGAELNASAAGVVSSGAQGSVPVLSSGAAGSPGEAPFGPQETEVCTPGTWQIEPSIANARSFFGAAVVGSNMYAITGFNNTTPYVTANERFDGTTWTAMAPIPLPHSQSRSTSVGTKVYVPGGFNSAGFGGPLAFMQIYDTVADTWSQGTALPAARSGVATAAFNNLVYVIAGFNPLGTGHTDVFIYDPVSNSYTTGAPMPAGQGNVAGV